ncbi:MAG TPA: type II toxin-antitoxin system PemK/MazF family toxin, partial [Isosphaeraceae bacterium]|jgi:mRNA interferase MazF|nr:type II toxin-antitoxin system PemK/MazF family toxin [Isosphaeraceae bacterium]
MSVANNGAGPARGEVWTVNLDPTVGREQAGLRPVVIVSVDDLNNSPRGLVIIAPVTGTFRALPTHIAVVPPEGGLKKPSVVMAEQVRAVSKVRLGRRLGILRQATMGRVEEHLRMLLGL